MTHPAPTMTDMESKLEDARNQRDAALAKLETTLTCVYCGQAYPPGTPSHGADILTEHIKVCPKHPLREANDCICTLLETALKHLALAAERDALEDIGSIQDWRLKTVQAAAEFTAYALSLRNKTWLNLEKPNNEPHT